MKPEDLKRLAQLTDAVKSRDLARLEALLAQDRGLEDEIERLSLQQIEDMKSGDNIPQLARRLAWAEAHIDKARRGRAALAAQIRAAREAAVQSLGRHEALEHLREKAAEDATREALARIERDAPAPEAQRRDY